jgi:parallel beta-helix repeat protein
LGGNLIGLAADGSSPLGNGREGVDIVEGATNTHIGGTGLAPNTIAANATAGIRISTSSFTNVKGNIIRSNDQNGVAVDGANGCSITGNTISDNGTSGVWVFGSVATGNTISANSIYDNGLGAIDLADGGNTELASPVISSASITGAAGTACASCRVELFSDDGAQGETYHGFTMADAGGNWTYNGALTGPYATATATDGSGNTSEFSTYPFVVIGTCANPLPLACGQHVEAIGLQADRLHQRDVLPPAVIVIAGRIARVAVLDLAGRVAEAIPDALALAVLVPAPFDLVR